MTESRGAMTAQQFWPKWIKDEGIWGGDAPVISKESGHRFADALSAHNTAQAEKKYSDHIEDCLVATAADDALIAELRAALEVARNEKAMLLIELQKYHIAERLRSQGAGQPRLGTCDTTDWPHLRSDGSGIKRLHERRESCTFWEEAAGLASPPEGQKYLNPIGNSPAAQDELSEIAPEGYGRNPDSIYHFDNLDSRGKPFKR